MGDKSRIEWCDATFNPVTGCTPVSAGCANCYAKRMYERFSKGDVLVSPFSEVAFHPDRLDQPLRWRKPRRIFVCSMGDLFHEDVKEEWIDRVMAIAALSPRHTFMLLTKRPDRMRTYISPLTQGRISTYMAQYGATKSNSIGTPAVAYLSMTQWPLPNLWLGVTAENQEMADQRIPILLQTPAAKRFISVEPMLGPVDLRNGEWASACLRLSWLHGTAAIGRAEDYRDRGLDWVILGGESGPGARPMHPDWPRSLRDQCQAAGVPFFFKQWGEWKPWEPGDHPHVVRHISARDGLWGDQPASVYTNPPSAEFEMRADTLPMCRVGKKAAGCLLGGGEHKEFPEVKG